MNCRCCELCRDYFCDVHSLFIVGSRSSPALAAPETERVKRLPRRLNAAVAAAFAHVRRSVWQSEESAACRCRAEQRQRRGLSACALARD
jgi:hypothetical protein